MTFQLPWRRADAGSISIEVAILLPAFMMFVMLATAYGRMTIARTAVYLAAHDAARAASMSRTDSGAQLAAKNAAGATLGSSTTTCTGFTAVPLVSPQYPDGFLVPAGTQATVTYEVTCQLSLADLALIPIPGSVTIVSTFTSPIDAYRSRSGS